MVIFIIIGLDDNPNWPFLVAAGVILILCMALYFYSTALQKTAGNATLRDK